jgi:amino acid adenylation domain-containing protein
MSASPAEKRALLAELLQRAAQGKIEPESFPLSYGQQALWLIQRMAPANIAYNVTCQCRIRGAADAAALGRAVKRLVERHPILRGTYGIEGGRPVQRVQREGATELQVSDARRWTAERLNARIQKEADEPFDLERGPMLRARLFERANDEHLLLLVIHHIAADLWSRDIIVTELGELYEAERTGTALALPRPSARYADFVQWQADMMASPRAEELWAYWREQLAGDLPALALPVERAAHPLHNYRGSAYHFDIDPPVAQRLREVARQAGCTPYVALLASFFVLLHRYSGQERFLVGSPAVGRPTPAFEDVVGYFVNALPLRADLSGRPSFAEVMRRAHQTVLGALDHQDFPYSAMVDRQRAGPPLQALFAWERPRELKGAGPPIKLSEDIAQRGAPFELTAIVFDRPDSLSVTLQYRVDLFSEQSIARMTGHWGTLLAAMVADPERPVSYLDLMTEGERSRVLREWNPPSARPPTEARVPDLVRAQAARTPDAVAVSAGESALTYRQLVDRAGVVARWLRGAGVRPGQVVAVSLERSADLVAALLGILDAGAAYLPLDPAYPAERLALMLEDAKPAVVLCNRSLSDRLPAGGPPLLLLESASDPGVAAPSPELPADLPAYVLYTSGSTGKPKGVPITNRALVSLLETMQGLTRISSEDALVAVTTISFDIATTELYLPLTVGARVVIADRATATNGPALRALLERAPATMMQATPATWWMLLDAGWTGGERFKAISTGEALERTLANRLVTKVGELWDLYGPTEATVYTVGCRIKAEEGPVPIGRPFPGTTAYVLDASMQPLPPGLPGQLYLGGEVLSPGYLGRPAETAARFVPNPFGPGRLYHTGDVARLRQDGTIDYLGRDDDQLKVQGHRIEPGEIEAVLLEHPSVGQAVVAARGAGTATRRLVAYLVAAVGQTPVQTQELRDFTGRLLPAHMVPPLFLWLTDLPRTPNGKVNRRALPDPAPVNPEHYVEPAAGMEQAIARVWARALHRDRVGALDNFFESGGSSLSALEVSAYAGSEGLRIRPEQIFKYPTLRELASVLAQSGDSPERKP